MLAGNRHSFFFFDVIIVVVVFFFFPFDFGEVIISSGPRDLFLPLNSGVAPDGIQWIMCGAGD